MRNNDCDIIIGKYFKESVGEGHVRYYYVDSIELETVHFDISVVSKKGLSQFRSSDNLVSFMGDIGLKKITEVTTLEYKQMLVKGKLHGIKNGNN